MKKLAFAPSLVAAVWLAMTVSAVWYVARHASSCPFQDDLETMVSLASGNGISFDSLMALHNDHRQPLGALIYAVLVSATGDCRAGMYFYVAVLALVSLALILVARAVRGRTSITDAFFPLLLQHLGNCENLLLAFQLILGVQLALLCGILSVVAAGPARPTMRTSLGLGLCLLGLPLSMASGLVQVPAIAAWMTLAGLGVLGSGRTESRSARRVMLAAVAGTVGLAALYLHDFAFSPALPGAHSENFFSTARITFRLIALSIGPGGMEYWPLSAWVISALVFATVALLAATIRRRPEERYRASGILACLAASLSLAASIGWGRGGMFTGEGDLPNHYVMLTAPLLCAVYLAWSRYGPVWPARLVRVALLSIVVLIACYNTRLGLAWGEKRRIEAQQIAADVAAGMSMDQLADRHWPSLYPGAGYCAARLEILHGAGWAPFAGRTYEANLGVPDLVRYPMFRTQPLGAQSIQPMLQRMLDGTPILLVQGESEIRFAAPAGARRLRARFGVSPDAVQTGRTDGVRFTVESANGWSLPVVLFECVLDPRTRPEDGGIHDLEVALQPDGQSKILLRTSNAPGRTDEEDWSFWTDVGID